MNLWDMSISGAIMIAAIVVIRALAINRLPKKTFLILWGVALIRLLVPYSLPSVFSVYSMARRLTQMTGDTSELPAAHTTTAAPITSAAATPLSSAMSSTSVPSMNPWTVIWLIGVAACAAFFAVAYWKCRRKFRESIPVDNDFIRNWLASQKLRRTMDVRQSDKISAPLTYGVFRPVILLPKRTNWEDETVLAYVLAHEYVHIRRFDALTKLVLTAALCVHWFNPAVWAMYVLANRDIELSCDEAVVRQFGERTRSAYAMTLIRMEETKSGLSPLYNNFSKNAIEERIIAIMKIKKISLAAVLAATALVVSFTTAFATSAQTVAQDNNIALSGKETSSSVTQNDNIALSDEETNSSVTQSDNIALSGEESNNSTADTEWWTAEEYEAWLEQEKANLQSIIGNKSWNPTDGWYTWTQEKVDETIASYEQTLQEIKDGKKVSKPTQDGNAMIQYDSNGTETATESGDTFVSTGDSDQPLSPELLAEYETFGLTYDESEEALYWKGKPVRYFNDGVVIDGNIVMACQYLCNEGTVDIYAVRQATQNADGSTDPFGKLTDIKEYKAGELDIDSLSAESIAESGAALESADQSESVTAAKGNYTAAESGDTGTEFMEAIAKYEPFGITFVKSGNFGNLYWNGKLVDTLADRSPDGGYMTFSSTDEGGVTLQTIYDNSGKLTGLEIIEN